MHRTTHKTGWGVVGGRATGILVLLAGILFAAGLCNASPSDDNAVPSIFQPHSTPAESSLGDRKSTRLNSSHQIISYAVFCLKKKKTQQSRSAFIRQTMRLT